MVSVEDDKLIFFIQKKKIWKVKESNKSVLCFATNLLICPKWSCSNKLSIAISLWNVKTIHQWKDQGNKKNSG